MNEQVGFDALTPEERALLLEALRDHIDRLAPAARSNADVARTRRMFQKLAQKLKAASRRPA
jgi:hypothetical protein